MKAIARRVRGFTHEVEVDGHTIVSDEPPDSGGTDEGPSPTRLLVASLAACTAITVEMYADRKGWALGEIEAEAELVSAERGEPARYAVAVRIPAELSGDQVERLEVIAGKCPVHRTLTGEVEIEDRIELVSVK